MDEASKAKIPLLIGTCGTSGTDSGVDWTRDNSPSTWRAKLAITPKIACLYSEQTAADLASRNRHGKITPLPPMVRHQRGVESCEHIVL